MRERTVTHILAGGMLALLLSAAAAAEPDDRPGAEQLPVPLSEITLSPLRLPVSVQPGARPAAPAPGRAPAGFNVRRVLRYEQLLQWDEVDLIFRIRALRSQRKLVVVELRF